MENPEILTTSKNGVKLRFRGYLYRSKSIYKNTHYWKCETPGCRASLHTSLNFDGAVEKGVHAQNHLPPDNDVVLAQQSRNAMKRQVEINSHIPGSQVYRRAMAELDTSVAAHLPAKDIVCRSLRRHKTKSRPPLPPTAEDLHLNPLYSTTLDGDQFVLRDETFQGSRLLLFASQFLLNLLFASSFLFIDGTFQMVPCIFHQLVTINIMYQGRKQIPVVYCLTRRRSTDVYRRILQVLKEIARQHRQSFQSAWVMVDFEMGIIQAIKAEFPHTVVRGCLFHFSQCCFRKIPNLGLSDQYRRDKGFRTIVRLHMALAFLPTEQIAPTFEILQREGRARYPQLTGFCDYFREQWIQSPHTGPALWSVHGHAIRTNNDLEGWHFSMTRDLPRSHPDIFTFIHWMKTEEKLTHNICAQIDMGQAYIKRNNKKYERIAHRLHTITTELDSGVKTRSSFLKGVVFNLAELPDVGNNDGQQSPSIEVDYEEQLDVFPWQMLNEIEGLDFQQTVPWRPF